jgi:hypothetical protein
MTSVQLSDLVPSGGYRNLGITSQASPPCTTSTKGTAQVLGCFSERRRIAAAKWAYVADITGPVAPRSKARRRHYGGSGSDHAAD